MLMPSSAPNFYLLSAASRFSLPSSADGLFPISISRMVDMRSVQTEQTWMPDTSIQEPQAASCLKSIEIRKNCSFFACETENQQLKMIESWR